MKSVTPRERQVLDFVVAGLSDNEIAHQMGLSLYTVHEYVQNIKDKSGLKRRVLLAIWWHDCGGLTA